MALWPALKPDALPLRHHATQRITSLFNTRPRNRQAPRREIPQDNTLAATQEPAAYGVLTLQDKPITLSGNDDDAIIA